jgi:hypothetical protein
MSIGICRCLARVVDLEFLQAGVVKGPSRKIGLNTLYSESIISPVIDDVKRFFAEMFRNKCTTSRYISLNFLGYDVKHWVSEQFLWYYLEVIKGIDAVDITRRPNWESVTTTRDKRYDKTNSLWHHHLTIDAHHIYFVWDRPEDLVINVVFSCDETLFTNDLPWADLRASCQR